MTAHGRIYHASDGTNKARRLRRPPITESVCRGIDALLEPPYWADPRDIYAVKRYLRELVAWYRSRVDP